MDKEEAPKIEGIKNTWAALSNVYKEHDSAAQTFYFSLINALNLFKSHHIL